MKKILAIIGSPNTEKSNTARFAQDFMENIRSFYPDAQLETVSIGGKKIGLCRGCWACMKTGGCVFKDDLQELQEKMLASDMILLGSPVYVHQVSAQYKGFIDRLFVWIHTFRLLGKPVVTVLTTASTGAGPTERYLRDSAVMFGAVPVGSIRAIAYRPGNFPKREYFQQKYLKLAKKMAEILSGKRSYRPTIMNFLMFMGMKWKVRRMTDTFEHGYWKDRGWFGVNYAQAVRRNSLKQEVSL